MIFHNLHTLILDNFDPMLLENESSMSDATIDNLSKEMISPLAVHPPRYPRKRSFLASQMGDSYSILEPEISKKPRLYEEESEKGGVIETKPKTDSVIPLKRVSESRHGDGVMSLHDRSPAHSAQHVESQLLYEDSANDCHEHSPTIEMLHKANNIIDLRSLIALSCTTPTKLRALPKLELGVRSVDFPGSIVQPARIADDISLNELHTTLWNRLRDSYSGAGPLTVKIAELVRPEINTKFFQPGESCFGEIFGCVFLR
ncbi:hypothetical protein H0H92_004633 [Tricholoma furcatifolium]|nr:hypothetical protein H0H92_004633 [Tricholoma furcatifolium]